MVLWVSICLTVSSVKASSWLGRIGTAQSQLSWITHPPSKNTAHIVITGRTYLILYLVRFLYCVEPTARPLVVCGLLAFSTPGKPSSEKGHYKRTDGC
jgi:hypothetical protein